MGHARRREPKGESRHTRSDDRLIEEVKARAHPQPRGARPVEAQTEAQAHYILAIQSAQLTFGVGPAGTGKTYVAGALAAAELDARRIERIIITRPAVEAGERMGFLPGELDEKYEPYLQPFREVLNERLGESFVEYLLKHNRIEAAPLAYMRGRTFRDAIVILDEAQNTTPVQMKMFLTRIGEDAKVIINGDITQTDIHGISGLEDAINRLQDAPGVRVVKFTNEDIVRSGLVREIIERYRN